MAVTAPCKDCADREVGCHSKCEKYLEFRKECDIAREQKIRQIDEYNHEVQWLMTKYRKASRNRKK